MVSQILAVLIFLVMFALIITEKIERHIVTLGCGLLMILLVFGITMHSGSAIMETLNIGSIFTADFWHASRVFIWNQLVNDHFYRRYDDHG